MLHEVEDIDRVLAALADPTRRWIVERLGNGPASVTNLAAPLPMSLPAVVQHLQVLERSGLVVSEKRGRVRTCRLDPERLATVEDWIVARRSSAATPGCASGPNHRSARRLPDKLHRPPTTPRRDRSMV